MADYYPTNEYLNTENARKDENDLFSAIGDLLQRLHMCDEEETCEDERVMNVDEIQGLCPKCERMVGKSAPSDGSVIDEAKGYTWHILVKIPSFQDVYLLSFHCDTCQYSSNELQPSNTIQDHGSKYTFRIDGLDDLERKIVRSDTAIFRVEDLDIEMPVRRGRLTNVEGILAEILRDLEVPQKQRKKEDPELWAKCDFVIPLLLEVLLGHKQQLPCTITLDDPAGNSWIEPPATNTQEQDQSKQEQDQTKYICSEYVRTPEQNEYLGLENDAAQDDRAGQVQGKESQGSNDVDNLGNHTYDWRTKCPGCARDKGHTIMQTVNIPHFKQIVVWSKGCEACNYTSSEVKIGGERSAKGQRIWIEIKGHEDFGRDILKSETCRLSIPEYGCSMEPGSVGARFTDVADLLLEMHKQLKGKMDGVGGDKDSSDPSVKSDKQASISPAERLSQAIIAESQFTILLEDPLHNSWCQSFDDLGPGMDSQIRCEDYERTKEDDNLGLTTIQT